MLTKWWVDSTNEEDEKKRKKTIGIKYDVSCEIDVCG